MLCRFLQNLEFAARAQMLAQVAHHEQSAGDLAFFVA
jgi:hypothetical protein